MALEHQGRAAIERQQMVVVFLVEQTRSVDRGDVALPLIPHVDELERPAALDHRLELRRRQLLNHAALAVSALMSRASRMGLGAPCRAISSMPRPRRSVVVTNCGNIVYSTGHSGRVSV